MNPTTTTPPDTPRTKARTFQIVSDLQSGTRDVVDAELCAQLETELGEAKAEIKRLLELSRTRSARAQERVDGWVTIADTEKARADRAETSLTAALAKVTELEGEGGELKLAALGAIEAASKYAATGDYENSDLVRQEFASKETIDVFEKLRAKAIDRDRLAGEVERALVVPNSYLIDQRLFIENLCSHLGIELRDWRSALHAVTGLAARLSVCEQQRDGAGGSRYLRWALDHPEYFAEAISEIKWTGDKAKNDALWKSALDAAIATPQDGQGGGQL